MTFKSDSVCQPVSDSRLFQVFGAAQENDTYRTRNEQGASKKYSCEIFRVFLNYKNDEKKRKISGKVNLLQ